MFEKGIAIVDIVSICMDIASGDAGPGQSGPSASEATPMRIDDISTIAKPFSKKGNSHLQNPLLSIRSHLRGRILFYTAGSSKSLGGLAVWVHRNKKKLSLRKKYVFAIEKYVRDVKQGQKNRSESCGIDNKAHSSCKRRDTEDFDENASI